MISLNRVMLIGNLCKDPEITYTKTGKTVCNINLAVNRKWTTENKEEKSEVCFVNVICWNKMAENCGKFIRKGSLILVQGHLKYDTWEKDGEKKSVLRVEGENIQFLSFEEAKEPSGHGSNP